MHSFLQRGIYSRHGPPIFGRRRRNIFGKRVEGDINQEEVSTKSNDLIILSNKLTYIAG